MAAARYEQLVEEAMATRFEGWDWRALRGRYEEGRPSWNYREIVTARLSGARSMLDLGTGGGELLSELAPLPERTVATEGYPPNVPFARRRLAPLGVPVMDTTGEPEDVLPFDADASFDLVTSRHESYRPAEVRRVPAAGGWFITQQVGGRDVEQLNAALGAPPGRYRGWDLTTAATELAQAGLPPIGQYEEHVPARFHDIGAVVLFLRITPWQVPDFDPARYRARLQALHASLSAGHPFEVTCHRFLLTARRSR